jgi:LuxR family maltose regulon positive regulatory protein
MPILATKLYIPPSLPNIVPRSRLIERLNEGLHRKLTLVSASAGFGKTTLMSEWVHTVRAHRDAPLQAAWLSLDEGDNDPARFLVYCIAALQTIEASAGKGASSALQSPQPPPIEAILTILINEVATIPGRIVLILDDYHLIEAQAIHEALAFLLERLPPQMHLVIATREDPPLPLARLRARGQLTELRAADLRFTPAEAAEFLNTRVGLNLSAEDIAALETRTEGWIAGLQLAAISMQGRADTASFIQAFTGSHRFVLDYLVEEVLQRQPERVRSFLLQTSILDRLCGSLCDAVCSSGTGVRFGEAKSPSFGMAETPAEQEDGKEMLEALERANLFVVPLDDERHWYRYHRLFADVLQAHLMEEQPERVSTLHQRASEWYERNGSPSDAIHHALAAEDFERAANLLELAWPAMDISYQSATWLGWVKALPDELVGTRPVLSVGWAWALLDGGEMEAVEGRLWDAERWLGPTDDTPERPEPPSSETCPERTRGMVVADEKLFRSLPASIATARAYQAQALGDISGAVKHARRALELTPEDDQIRYAQASALLGLACWASGDLEAANRSFTDFTNMLIAGDIPNAIGGAYVLADIRMALGHLCEAESTYQQALQLAAGQDGPMPLGMADLYRGMSELLCERGDLESAAQYLLRGKELGDQAALPDWQRRLCITQARMRQTQGDLDGALDLLDEAERVYIKSPLPDVRPIAAQKTRIWIRQGRLAKALAWARERGLSVDDNLSYLREFEHITLARALIAQFKSDRADDSIREAMGLLSRLLEAAEKGGRTGSVIEILVLQALAHQALSDIPLALTLLEHALALAEPEGYVRIFVDEGPPMAALLREAAKRGTVPNYASQLLAAFGKAESKRPVTQHLIEPLSERELEVLKLLRTELSGPEIARELVVSLSTMRTHTRNVYSKLGVNSRRAAVRRAEELDLL